MTDYEKVANKIIKDNTKSRAFESDECIMYSGPLKEDIEQAISSAVKEKEAELKSVRDELAVADGMNIDLCNENTTLEKDHQALLKWAVEAKNVLEYTLGREVFPQGVTSADTETEAHKKVKAILSTFPTTIKKGE